MKESPREFLDRMEAWKNLPSLPHILLRMIELCNNERSTIRDISQVVNKDPSLSAEVLRLANSSIENRPCRIKDIEQALFFLGTDTLKKIVFNASISQAFYQDNHESVFRLNFFWWHSLMCATLAKLVAKKTFYAHIEEAYLSGLLHDIGKLILWVHFKKEYAEIVKSSKDKSDLILAGEARLGVSHSEAGAWLLSRANPQSFIADAVLYHHERTDRIQDAFPLTKIVYVANRLCPETIQDKKFKFGVAEDLFGLSASEVEEIIVQAQGEVEDAAHSLGIDIESLERSGQAISDKNHKKQQDLIREAREISLLGCTLQNLLKAYDEDAILKVLHEGFRILLDVKQTYFFLYDSESHLLIGKDVASEGEDSLINELSIPFHKGNSLFVKSLRQRMPVHSFGNSMQANPAIIDEQVIRLIGKDGILCIPMFANKQPIGITFFGVDEGRLSHLLRHEKLLTIFCSQGASALHAYHLRQSQIKPIQPEPLSTSPVTRKVLHNLNTPLNIVKNYLTIVGRKLAEENRVQEELGIINEEIGRIALMIRELSEFSEPEAQPEDRQDVNALLTDFVRIFQKSLLPGPNIQFHLNLDPALPAVLTKKNSLKQVFINLFENAVEAMPKGGNLYIGTRHLPEGPDIKTGQEWKTYVGYVEITIRDDGPGIPEAIRPRLFEPLVTSKGEGHAGLGLSIVHDMVKELEGSITYETGDQAGTSFRIILPIG